jgi:hypothetical protein
MIDEDRLRARLQRALGYEPPSPGFGAQPLSKLAVGTSVHRNAEESRNSNLLALVAAVIALALVVTLVLGARALYRTQITPVRTGPHLTVSPATPVILFIDLAVVNRGNGTQIDGMTWDGQVSGEVYTIDIGAGPANSAGTLFVAFPDILDRSGRVVGELGGGPYAGPGVGAKFFGMFADDELHYCQVVPFFAPSASEVPATLQLVTPSATFGDSSVGDEARDVAQVGQISPNVNNVRVAACSVLGDRAVVVETDPTAGALVYQYWVVQLSTGRVLWTHDLRGGPVSTQVVASRDGQYVAEIDATGTTTIFGPNGSAVGHLTGSVEGFSWDGSEAVVDACPSGLSYCSYAQATVTRWRDGVVVWAGPHAQILAGSQPEPGGASLAIEIVDRAHPINGDTSGMSGYPTVLYVVSSEGQVLGQREVARMLGG